MLKKLLVRNYALIRELEIGFDKGLTIMTGETGAGKSIILGALSLILGNRADSSSLLDKSSKCIVEGQFDLGGIQMTGFFEKHGLDEMDPAVMRREISPNGRSRAFINDSPVTLDIMKEMGIRLIDIHSQHQSLLLGSNTFQLSVIDSFAGHNDLLGEYRQQYGQYTRLNSEYKKLAEKRERNFADLDYYTYQLKQLDEEKLNEGEEKELEAEQELLMHAGDIHEALAGSSLILNGNEHSVINRLNDMRRLLEKISDFYPDAGQLLQRLESVIIELNDLGNETEQRSSVIDSDPGRLEHLTQRLDTLNALMLKHRAADTKELIDKREEIRAVVRGIETGDERFMELEKKLGNILNRLKELAGRLSVNRNDHIPAIEKEMNRLLVQMGIPNGRFVIKLGKSDAFTEYGRDNAEFLFSANRQVLPENIGRVASGGELSRVMLSLKSLLTDNKSLPTIIFDEIDAGVSGEVATKVGNILSSMGEKMQVINITHLPQVAAHATMHYYVYKEDEADSTITRIKLLNKKERLKEVARLLSGNEITRASLDNARELIEGVG